MLRAQDKWRLCRVRIVESQKLPPPLSEIASNLGERENALGIIPEQPFLLRPDGSPDIDVLLYTNSRSFRRLTLQSQESYLEDLKVYFSYLEGQNKDWRKATKDDFFNYEFWRRREPKNPRRVSGTKFSRELSACRKFYNWQLDHGIIRKSPIPSEPMRQRDGRMKLSIPLRPKNVRSTRVKWLTPRAFRRWQNVGLGGYQENGLREST